MPKKEEHDKALELSFKEHKIKRVKCKQKTKKMLQTFTVKSFLPKISLDAR